MMRRQDSRREIVVRLLITSPLARIRNHLTSPGEEPRMPSPPLSPPPSPSILMARTQQPDNMVRPDYYPSLFRSLFHDPLLLSAFAACALLIVYQAGVTILHPAWIGPVTDWLRAALAPPEVLVLIGVSIWLSRTHHPAARSWWMWSAALLSYSIARISWTVADQLIFHQGVPFPTYPDLFFVLQYPFFFLAVILLPRTRFWGSRLILTVDGLLVMGAAAAISWNFILAPLYTESGISPLARAVSLTYPVGDLFVLFGLMMTLMRPSRYRADRLVLQVLVPAVLCLIIADSWVGWLLLSSPHVYRTGGPPDVFWIAFYLLIPLAGLCQFRLTKQVPEASGHSVLKSQQLRALRWADFTTSLRFFLPIVVALLASGALMVHATMVLTQGGWRRGITPFALSAGLLLLVLVRQVLTFLEMAQLRRETEYAQANAEAMRELNRRKDEFLGIVGHELKTPLTSLQGYLELLTRRFAAWHPAEDGVEELARTVATARRMIQYSDESLHRIIRLVNDLLDDAQVRDGHLALLLDVCDLGVIVRKAVDEQRMLAPGRTISLDAPAATNVPITADASRIAQVVTNYLTNALKYSKDDRPVSICLEVRGSHAHVLVHDEGIGIPIAEQAHIWERFRVIEGNRVQSGSGVSLGIGLHISKGIIERHHGRVGVRSVPGQDSTFWFTLPLASSAT